MGTFFRDYLIIILYLFILGRPSLPLMKKDLNKSDILKNELHTSLVSKLLKHASKEADKEQDSSRLLVENSPLSEPVYITLPPIKLENIIPVLISYASDFIPYSLILSFFQPPEL